MSMFGPTQGWWHFSSKSDPRWDVSNKAKVGGLLGPEARIALENLKKLYGKVPIDLEYGYMKD